MLPDEMNLSPITVALLDTIVHNSPLITTRCARTREYIIDCLSPCDGRWRISSVNSPTAYTVGEMKELVDKYRYLVVDIDYDDQGVYTGHTFILCATRDGYRIIDSYTDCRPISHRRFNFEDLRELVVQPSLERWNRVFICDEIVDDSYSSHGGGLVITCWYDRSHLRKLYPKCGVVW